MPSSTTPTPTSRTAPGDFGIFEPGRRLKPAFPALQAVLRRTPPRYFDGDTPGCRWLGTPGESPSIQG